MRPTITAFADSPDEGQGQARDMRVRWALEEVDQPYDVRLVPWKDFKGPEHLARQPFGQIPTYEEGDLTLFESGSIILHIGETREGLLPQGADARAQAITWMFAALNTMEPPIVQIEEFMLMEKDKPWYAERLPMLQDRARARLGALSEYLGTNRWLEGEFTAGDLMMVMVLRRTEGWGLLDAFPTLCAYVARGEARPAFQRAFTAQHEVWLASQAAASPG